jgi:archaellum component FlaG (FlaF/FlaG flagellin family)
MTTVIEILELRLQLASLQDNLKQFMSHPSKPENEENSNNLTLSFAEAVKNTMKETLNDQETRAEVIISEVKDEGKDLEFMTGLCEKMKQTSKPKQVS